MNDKKPDLGALMKNIGAAIGGGKGDQPAPEPKKPDDTIDKGPKKQGIEALGAKAGASGVERDFTVRPPPEELLAAHGQKDAERLKILTRAPIYQQAEKRWLEKLAMKLQLPGPPAARKLGFGPWKKKYESKTALAAALEANIKPVFAKLWAFEVPALVESGGEDRQACAFAELTGDPPLHPAYASDLAAYELVINQDEIKHVCHGYVMLLCHAWFRTLVKLKREQGMNVATDASGLSPDHVYVLEVNLCQHYVPSSTAAYFEGQPLRALAREVSNAFRKLAFGGQ